MIVFVATLLLLNMYSLLYYSQAFETKNALLGQKATLNNSSSGLLGIACKFTEDSIDVL